MESFECWLPSWDYIQKACKKVSAQIKKDGFKPDIVIALSRGGFVPSRCLCDLLIIKDLVSVKVDHWGITANKDGQAKIRYPLDIDLTGKKVLIVDDITDTGDSMIVSADFIKTLNPSEIKTATVFHIKTSKFMPDYYGEEIDWKWVVFPWNYVEDMCNIIPKVLESSPKSIKRIKIDLNDNFKIDISGEELVDVLLELKERGAAKQNDIGWSKLES